MLVKGDAATTEEEGGGDGVILGVTLTDEGWVDVLVDVEAANVPDGDTVRA